MPVDSLISQILQAKHLVSFATLIFLCRTAAEKSAALKNNIFLRMDYGFWGVAPVCTKKALDRVRILATPAVLEDAIICLGSDLSFHLRRYGGKHGLVLPPANKLPPPTLFWVDVRGGYSGACCDCS